MIVIVIVIVKVVSFLGGGDVFTCLYMSNVVTNVSFSSPTSFQEDSMLNLTGLRAQKKDGMLARATWEPVQYSVTMLKDYKKRRREKVDKFYSAVYNSSSITLSSPNSVSYFTDYTVSDWLR